ncbi:AraC family transcriptional regulator [Nocardia sp. NPDC050435]|uniref:AraC family transcriptional regulator n=1 Tax=Nocardia sp. NPDC050435 TaxID=3155040 RepID=UPI003408B044
MDQIFVAQNQVEPADVLNTGGSDDAAEFGKTTDYEPEVVGGIVEICRSPVEAALIRSAALRGFRATVAEMQADAEQFARSVGVPIPALDADEIPISPVSLVELLNHAAAILECPDLGLRIAGRQDLSALGSLATALQSCATLGDALDCATRYLFVHSPTIALAVVPDPYGAAGVEALRYSIPARGRNDSQAIDLGLGAIHRYALALAGGRYGLRSVELPHRPAAPLSSYEEFFQAPVRFGCSAALLRVPCSLRRQPIPGGGNRHLRELAEALLIEQLPTNANAILAPRVRAALHHGLGRTPVDIATIASRLSVTPRTLQRRLAEEGTSFSVILDDVRRHTAARYLTDTTMALSDVATRLGLAEQSILTRYSKRWWGVTPTTLRRHGTLPRSRT